MLNLQNILQSGIDSTKAYYIPNKTSKKIQEVIDGIPQVVSSKNVVEMNLDICKVRPKVHLRDLQVPVLVDDDGRLGVDVELVDLQPHGTITVQGEDADYEASQVVHGITLEYSFFNQLSFYPQTKVCVFDLVHVFSDNLSLRFYNQNDINSKDKVCVLGLVQAFSYNLSLHFFNQSEINSEDDTK